MLEKITHIKEIGYDEAIDIEVSGNHLFYANDILTHNSNSDVSLEDVSESFGLPATADFMFAIITGEQLNGLNQLMVKQLKNRYNDPNMYKKFVIGVDRAKMRLYNVEQTAQQDIIDESHDTSNVSSIKKKFDKSLFEDFT